MVGKFPYIFGTFFYESGTPIHTDYDLIARRRKFAEGDPMCKGCVLWPEASHVDVLELRHFTDNAWRFVPQTVPELVDAFCRDRYGEDAAAFAEVWRKALPISVACSSKQGPWRANYADMVYAYLGSEYSLARPESFPAHGRKAYAAAPGIFRAIAKLPRRDAWQRRDAADLARTVGDRLVLEAVCDAQLAWFAWRDGEQWATPAAVLERADAALRFVGLMGRLLAQHGDFSLCDTFAATDEIERIRLPNFDQVLLQNAINGYCLSHQAEAAVHLYPAMYRTWRDELAKALERGDRAASLTGAGVRGHVAEFWKRRLRDLRTAEPRTDDNWRATMLEFAAATDGWLDVP
jgi:hypothetical protein